MLNNVSNSEFDLQCHFVSLPKDRNGISVIEFSSPAMWSGVIRHVPFCLSRRASARIRWADTRDPRVASRRTHPTVGELSLNSATFFSRRFPHTCSITSHSRNRPAISRSEFVISSNLYRSLTSWDHSHRNTVGSHSSFSPNITPPAPCDDASHTPM